jgi:type IX secretion system PorP/SprF family membrane protein
LKTRILITTLFIAQIWAGSLCAQDPIFSQFFTSPMQLNPAFSGHSMGTSIALNYRNQWPSFNQAYVTYSAAVDHYLDGLNSGIGLYVNADDAGRGILKTFKFAGTYAYQVRLGEDLYSRLGVEAGAINSVLDWNKLIFLDQIDPEFGLTTPGGTTLPTAELMPESLSTTVFDAAVGVLVHTSDFYAGVSLKHINAPDIGFYKEPRNQLQRGLPLRIMVQGGTDIILQKGLGRFAVPEVFFSPSLMFAKQGSFQQLVAGSMFTYKQLFSGLWFRHAWANGDALAFHLGGRFDKFRIGYSYDFTVSRLYNVSGGSHEISFIVHFAPDKKRIDTSDCFQLYR